MKPAFFFLVCETSQKRNVIIIFFTFVRIVKKKNSVGNQQKTFCMRICLHLLKCENNVLGIFFLCKTSEKM